MTAPVHTGFQLPLTLDNCDREPIHIPGYIQPHGALFGFDRQGLLAYRSANAQELLGGTMPDLGQPLAPEHFADYDGVHDLIAAARDAADGDVIPHATEVESPAGRFYVIAHRTASGLVCEFESSVNAAPVPTGFSFAAHRATERLKREQTIDGLLKAAVDEVRRMTGFDRVMAYRFRHDDSGDVVAESVSDALEPFVGRRYPASDIPAQARRLYIINTLRLIADVSATPVPVLAVSGEPLDMSHGVLRSVSPVHIEYLSNMKVAASMSVSIVIGGRLWGMLACHHMAPRRVSYTVRMACDVLAQILASNLQGVLSREQAALADAAASLRSRVVEAVLHADDLILALSSEASALQEAFGAHGVVVASGAKVAAFGGINVASGAALVQWLNAGGHAAGRMVFMDNLDALPAPLPAQMDVWCGLLALPFGAESPSWLLMLRKEQVETVMWGGRPEKDYATGPLGPRLTPRGSFDLWREIVNGKAVPWSTAALDSGQKLLDELVRADAAHMAELGRARGQLMAMLGHDLRDPIQSISNTATLMQRRGDDGPLAKRLHSSSTRMQRLVGQVMDMSMAHSGGLRFEMSPFDLAALTRQLVAESHSAHTGLQILLDAPDELPVLADADRLAQVISNLLSNAKHHGTPGEAVSLRLTDTGGTVALQISNHGQAIAADLAATLFQPFKRNAAKSPTNRNGLGLGLYIASEVMEGHGGTLAYEFLAPHVVFTATLPAPA